MAKAPAFQFYAGDWLRDTGLQRCSLSARGLWIQLLCLMHDGVPYGHLATAHGPILEPKMIARLVGGTVAEVKRTLAELESGEVFSRTEAGGIYSRRMVRDQSLRQQRAEWGKLSIGHPSTHPPRVPPTVPFDPPPASASASASATAKHNPETTGARIVPSDSDRMSRQEYEALVRDLAKAKAIPSGPGLMSIGQPPAPRPGGRR